VLVKDKGLGSPIRGRECRGRRTGSLPIVWGSEETVVEPRLLPMWTSGSMFDGEKERATSKPLSYWIEGKFFSTVVPGLAAKMMTTEGGS